MISSTKDGYGIKFDFLHPFQCFYQYDIYRGHKYNCKIEYNAAGQLTVNDEEIESSIDKHFPNYHIFVVPTLHHSFIKYNTITRRVIKHITQDGVHDMDCTIDAVRDNILHDNYKLIKMFESNNIPIYSYFIQ